MREIDDIIIHCSATKEGIDYHAADIDRWHKDRGFRCIGYHYVIDLDGTVELGRPVNEVGAHCIEQRKNKTSIGICYIGGLNSQGEPDDTRTPAQIIALEKLLSQLCASYRVPIHGHRDYCKNKKCPCFDAHEYYRYIWKKYL